MSHRWSLFTFFAAWGLGVFPPQAGATNALLGRLFLTPEQRQLLDRQRQSAQGEASLLTGEVLRLDGIVRRGGGATTVWVNGQRLAPGSVGPLVVPRGTSPDQARLATQTGGETLAVGEGFHRPSGQRRPLLGSGILLIQRQR
ncbi:hypothetical protein DLREEDagrD3_23030 [Denitratisoma sp. agr-D3]